MYVTLEESFCLFVYRVCGLPVKPSLGKLWERFRFGSDGAWSCSESQLLWPATDIFHLQTHWPEVQSCLLRTSYLCYSLFCSIWSEPGTNFNSDLLWTHYLTKGDQWKFVDEIYTCFWHDISAFFVRLTPRQGILFTPSRLYMFSSFDESTLPLTQTFAFLLTASLVFLGASC